MRNLILTARAVLFIYTIFFFGACQKHINETSPSISSDHDLVYEQAYPGVRGESFTTWFNGQEIHVVKKGGRYVWMGDIAFDQATFDSLNRAAAAPNARTYKPTLGNHWPRGEVAYLIGAGFTSDELSTINAALNHWRNNTTLSFTQRTYQSNYIYIQKGASGSGWSSDYIGMKGGQQVINLAPGFVPGTVIHEIGHTIGFYHEQCRADRDQFINVYFDRLIPNDDDTRYQFQTYVQRGQSGAEFGAFDFNSIMLYGSTAASTASMPAMTRKDGTTWIAQRNGLSTGDIETTVIMYGPPYARIEYVNQYYQDDWSSGYEYVLSIDDIIVQLYADKQCTIPYTTPVPINYTYRVYTSSTIANYYNTYNATFAAGTSTALLDWYTTTREYRTDYGNVQIDYTRSYQGMNGFFRYY